jgi:hypothetical protein
LSLLFFVSSTGPVDLGWGADRDLGVEA